MTISIQRLLEKPIPSVASLPRNDSWLGRLVRVAMFQMAAANDGFIERYAFQWKWNQLHQVSCCNSKGSYDPQRCRDSQRILMQLGGEPFSVIPRDKEAVIQGMFFDPKQVKCQIEQLGGTWEKTQHENKDYFVIKPPKEKSVLWDEFFKQVLEKMYWKSAPWDQNVIITAENVEDVELIREENKCVMMIDVTVPWPMHRREIGKFIGLGCQVVIHNARGVVIDSQEVSAETGIISEAACYEDIGVVLTYLQQMKGIAKSDVILRGSCLNAAIAVHILAQYAQEGINAFLDNVPISPREILEGHTFHEALYDSYIKATQSLPDSPLRTQFGIQENGFNSFETIKQMPLSLSSSSKVLLTATEGDFATPPEKVERVFKELCTKFSISNCQYVLQNLAQFEEGETLTAHMASAIRNSSIQKIFLNHFNMTKKW